MTGRLRVAIGQISSESNHFVSFLCELAVFRNTGYLLERDDLFKLKATATEIAGMLDVLDLAGDVEVIPLLAARANSSGPLSEICYETLKGRLLAALREAGSVDGVLLSHHGSMAAVNEDDPEGDIAGAVRAIVGPNTQVVMTLDLHGNVTRRMVEASNAILGYEHYPHDDVFTTGQRAAKLLLKAMRGEAKPVIGHAKLPMLLTAFNGSTAFGGPFAQLMQQAKAREQESGILSTSLFFVGSYIDMPDMGSSALVVADGDGVRAASQAATLAEQFWARRGEFVIQALSVQDAVRYGRDIPGGPVLLLDTADTMGGGASGDGAGLIKGLLDANVSEDCMAMVVDPDAAQSCLRTGVGSELTIDLGHKLDPQWGNPLRVTGKVLRTSGGQFQYTGGILGGTWASMGSSVVFGIGNIQVVIMSYPTYDWADEQYRSMGMDPAQAKFVGVKNMMNFRYGYRQIMKGYFVLDLPGPTPADLRSLPFRRVRRPIFPLDNLETPSLEISRSKF